MSDSLRMPCAWDATWESPVPTTQGRGVPVPAPMAHAPLLRVSVAATQGSSYEVPLPTTLDPRRAVPIPTTQPPSHRSWDRDYNPFGFPAAPLAEVREDAPEMRQPSSTGYALFADSSNTGGNDAIHGDNKPPIVIAVFGQTGTGKTSFIKAVTGKDLQIGHSLTSCTEDVLAVPFRIGNENVMLVDTPGFSDTNISDTEILRRIAAWMKDTYDDGCLLSGIIYLHRIIDPRMDGPSLKNLRMMQKLCGANSLKNVILATTMWEKVTEEEGSMREAELKQTFWKDMIRGGSTVRRIQRQSGDDARALVKSLLKNKPTSTRLQEELHSGMSLVQTEAGTEIKEEMAKLERKLKAEHEHEILELKGAQRDRKNRFSVFWLIQHIYG
ncbi:GTP-binding A [Hyphodiscus hymeniophilus]|uniref:GTP-binding A n=1 Tax=Hyphodiscus hymeniophilus TaxID=353542 RepID=A0A9P6VJD1_9HELO|nr:GTP-binding A [Hyphodiscus hymeniophilus]